MADLESQYRERHRIPSWIPVPAEEVDEHFARVMGLLMRGETPECGCGIRVK